MGLVGNVLINLFVNIVSGLSLGGWLTTHLLWICFSVALTKTIVLFRRQILVPRLLGNIELTHVTTLICNKKIPFFWLDYHVIVPVSAEGLNWL